MGGDSSHAAGAGGEGGSYFLAEGGASSAGVPFVLLGVWHFDFSMWDGEYVETGDLVIQADGTGSLKKAVFFENISGSGAHPVEREYSWKGTLEFDWGACTITLHSTETTPADAGDTVLLKFGYSSATGTLTLVNEFCQEQEGKFSPTCPMPCTHAPLPQ
jgi:hypothetical protein